MRALVTEAWLVASGGLVLIGLLAQADAIVVLGVLLLASGGLSRLWSRLALEELYYERRLEHTRIFVGESTQLRLSLANRKLLPVPWLEVQERFATPMEVLGGAVHPSGVPRTVVLYRNTSLAPNEELSWPLTLRAVERGYYRIGATRLRSGDLFGFFDREREVGGRSALVVYPQTVPLPQLTLVHARPFGEQRGGHPVFEDPERVVGLRDYLPGDPLKRVDWKATARAARLVSRVYEPSRTRAVVVALNITPLPENTFGSNLRLLERSVVVAASVAVAAFEERSALGLVANGSFQDADRPIRIGAGRSPEQLNRVLEALAMISGFTTSRLADELTGRARALPAGATVVVVSAVLDEALAASLRRLRGEGHDVLVLKVAPGEWEHRAELGPIRVISLDQHLQELEDSGEMHVPEALANALPLPPPPGGEGGTLPDPRPAARVRPDPVSTVRGREPRP